MKLDNFCVVGISHKTMETEAREEFKRRGLKEIGEELLGAGKLRGYVELSTCLREELYLHRSEGEELGPVLDELKSNEHVFIHRGMEALNHLFRVVCGLESVIKGEDQILSQIRKAYSECVEAKRSSTILNIIFHRGIELGKKFRSKSRIAENALSLEAISVKLIKEKTGCLDNKSILVLGAGDLSQGILNILQKEKIEAVYLTNRTMSKAEEAGERYGVTQVVEFYNRYEIIKKADIIISTTSSPHPVIERAAMEEKGILNDRRRLFLDLAVPRDIEDEVGEGTSAEVCNIDSVWDVYRRNAQRRDEAGREYLYLLEKQREVLLKWFRYREELEKAC